MTLPEWTATVIRELGTAGFAAFEQYRLPFITSPETFDDKYRLLNLRLSLSVHRTIYFDGVLFSPPGSLRLHPSDVQPPTDTAPVPK